MALPVGAHTTGHGSFFNPQGFPAVPEFLSWNTAVSFTTNTNWQNYGGETTMSYLTQMAGLAMAMHNFLSAAMGIAWAVALVRGLARRSAGSIGSFWVDLVRATVYLLLPLAIVSTLVLVWQGVPQNFNPYTAVHGLEGFFTPGNLTALRVLALRATAREVEDDLSRYMRDQDGVEPVPLGERVMVAVDHRPMAGSSRPWTCCSVLGAAPGTLHTYVAGTV